MSVFSDDEVTAMRDTVEAHFLDVVVISRPARNVDAEGDVTGPAGVGVETRGTLRPPRASERQVAAQRGEAVDAVLSVGLAVDVRDGDLVDVAGQRFTATTVAPMRNSLQVTLVRVEP